MIPNFRKLEPCPVCSAPIFNDQHVDLCKSYLIYNTAFQKGQSFEKDKKVFFPPAIIYHNGFQYNAQYTQTFQTPNNNNNNNNNGYNDVEMKDLNEI